MTRPEPESQPAVLMLALYITDQWKLSDVFRCVDDSPEDSGNVPAELSA